MAMMIDPGEYFVITSDLNCAGFVYRVMEVCHTMVAAKIVFPAKVEGCSAFSIDTAVIGIMTVTPRYLESLLSVSGQDTIIDEVNSICSDIAKHQQELREVEAQLAEAEKLLAETSLELEFTEEPPDSLN